MKKTCTQGSHILITLLETKSTETARSTHNNNNRRYNFLSRLYYSTQRQSLITNTWVVLGKCTRVHYDTAVGTVLIHDRLLPFSAPRHVRPCHRIVRNQLAHTYSTQRIYSNVNIYFSLAQIARDVLSLCGFQMWIDQTVLAQTGCSRFGLIAVYVHFTQGVNAFKSG